MKEKNPVSAPRAQTVVGRFAPSPSGRMHLGNVFSALLAWLSVRAQGGELLLRIEDLDPERCRPEYAAQLRDDLRWLGLFWDREEAPQSARSAIYAQELEKLRAAGLLYPCYCTRRELHEASAPHLSDGRVLYSGVCRSLTEAQRAEKKTRPAWRVIVPDETITVHDGLQGVYRENLAQCCGDFIVRRSDGVFAYQLAVVADDARMGVTEVVRGWDLLSSTPRQLYLYRILGYTPPRFYHVPLLVAADGRRLSKRDRDLDLGVLRRSMDAEALLGRLAQLAGLLERPERISAQELCTVFSWSKVKKQREIVVSAPFL